MIVIYTDKEVVKGVKVTLTPGHNRGSQSVAIETENGTAVITGFCCINQNFLEGVRTVFLRPSSC